MTPLLLTLHAVDAYLAIALMGMAALYGFAAHRHQPASVSRGYRALLIGGAAVLALQVPIGLAILASGLRPADVLHVAIYGALSPLVLPSAYLYVRGRGRGHPNLAFALVSFFLFAFLIRALFTA